MRTKLCIIVDHYTSCISSQLSNFVVILVISFIVLPHQRISKQGKILVFLHCCKLAIERSDIGIITPDISFLFVLIAEVIKWSCIFKGGAVQFFYFFIYIFFNLRVQVSVLPIIKKKTSK